MGFVGGITGGQRSTYNTFIPSFVVSFRGFGDEGGGGSGGTPVGLLEGEVAAERLLLGLR